MFDGFNETFDGVLVRFELVGSVFDESLLIEQIENIVDTFFSRKKTFFTHRRDKVGFNRQPVAYS